MQRGTLALNSGYTLDETAAAEQGLSGIEALTELEFYFENEVCWFTLGQYPKTGRIGIQIDSGKGPLDKFTVNLVGETPRRGCVFVKDSETYAPYKLLRRIQKLGLFEKTGRIVFAGFVARYAYEWQWLNPTPEHFAALRKQFEEEKAEKIRVRTVSQLSGTKVKRRE